MKLVILDEFTINPGDLSWDELKFLGKVVTYPRTTPLETLERIADADIVLTSKVVLSENILVRCKKLKMVCVLATGYNNIDISCANSLGIVVSNIPSYSSQIVAQHTIALLLQLASLKRTALKNSTLGIIGYGNISSRVIPIASAFDMKVLVSTRYPDSDTANVKFVPLVEVFKNSDFISLHCPLNRGNQGFINEETIACMKSGVKIINTSRGGLINDHDLAVAIRCGKVGGAALDVLSQEPPVNGNPLINLQNALITPHIAWSGKSTRKKLIEIATANIKGFLNGKPLNVI